MWLPDFKMEENMWNKDVIVLIFFFLNCQRAMLNWSSSLVTMCQFTKVPANLITFPSALAVLFGLLLSSKCLHADVLH